MNKKAAKKLKRLASLMALKTEKPLEVKNIYKRLKDVYKTKNK